MDIETTHSHANTLLAEAAMVLEEYGPDWMITNPDHPLGKFHDKLTKHLRRASMPCLGKRPVQVQAVRVAGWIAVEFLLDGTWYRFPNHFRDTPEDREAAKLVRDAVRMTGRFHPAAWIKNRNHGAPGGPDVVDL